MKYEYEVEISIKTKFESNNPYSSEEVMTNYIYTLIQKNIENIEREISNISNSKSADNDDYLKTLNEEKEILRNLINDKFNMSVKQIKNKNYLKIIK